MPSPAGPPTVEGNTAVAGVISIGDTGNTIVPSTVVEPIIDKCSPIRFQLDSAKVEVVGVCKFSESGALCWNPQGEIDKALTSRTLTRFRKGGDRQGMPISFQMDRKNRAILVRIGSSTNKFESQVASYSASRYGFASQTAPSMKVPSTQDGLELLSFILNQLTDKTASAYAAFREPTRKPLYLPCKVGSTGELDGIRWKIASIDKAHDWWTVRLVRTGKLKPRRELSIVALDFNGKSITRTDEFGKPVSEDIATRELRAYQQQLLENPDSETNRPEFRSGKPTISRELPNSIDIAVRTDPQYIDRLYLTSSKIWNVEITGIPLDPIKRLP